MKALIIRGLDDQLYKTLKAQSQRMGLSINKFILRCLEGTLSPKRDRKFHDLDDFFGVWSEKEHKAFNETLSAHDTIDEEAWK